MTRKSKTMIVDDEEVSAELLEIMLNRQGIIDIDRATSGPQAIEAFETGIKNGTGYGLVFLDIIMPGMDGLEALKRLRAAEEKEGIATSDRAAIIMTTALTTTDAMIEAILDGNCTDYLVKPIDPLYLWNMLANNGLITRLE